MKLFTCQACAQLLYFENTRCERCGHALGYLPEAGALSALEPEGDTFRALAAPGRGYRYCANHEHGACNWLIEAGADQPYCIACQHNRTVPALWEAHNLANWQKLEGAKHRLFYTLLKLRLPLNSPAESPDAPLMFDFLADSASGPKVITGHDNGLITLNIAEADDAEREKRRSELGEPYRTLLGHMRHEVGHFYWDRIVRDRGRLESCRAVFGDDERDYAEALQTHYRNGPVPNWQERYVSSYAGAHAWEDFAETWAHYLHIIDTMETAAAFRLTVDPAAAPGELRAEVDFDVYEVEDFGVIMEAWLPLSFAVNSLNRSMGQPDLYPFLLSQAVIEKLAYMHELIRGSRVG